MSHIAVWTCPNGHPDWKRPTPEQMAGCQDVWFDCHVCGARWKATSAQRDLLIHSTRIRQQFGELADEAASLGQRVQQAARDDATVERRRTARREPAPAQRFEYASDHERRRIWVRLAATATAEDLITIIDRQIADHAWTYGLLYDLKTDNPVPLTADEARRVAGYVGHCVRTFGRRGPVAIVTRNVNPMRSLVKYATEGERLGFDVNVFVAVSDAERWLDRQQALRRDS